MKLNKSKKWHTVALILMIYDVIAIALSYFGALLLRFDLSYNSIPKNYLNAYFKFVPLYALMCVVIFYFLKLYQSIWKYASYTELCRVIVATFVTIVVHYVLMTLLFERMPVSYYVFGIILQFITVIGIRFSYRFVLLYRKNLKTSEPVGKVMIIGAGAAGQLIMRDIKRSSQMNDEVCCFIDDDCNKWNRFMDNVPIVGGRDSILENVEKFGINKIYIAIPSAKADEKRDILNICNETSCELKQLPGVYQLVNGDVSVKAMKDVSVEDLLGREPIKADLKEVFEFITGKTILVTGGGGSIGSELCRQIASHNPKQLIIFDVYENNAYAIQLELRAKYPNLNLVTLIGSVRDSRKINSVFKEYRPDIVYHAAAHKHVPLMEDSPCESIKNNAIGTYKTAYAAMLYGCKRFVLISTDKAVNPTNIMGASKRLCEMIIQSFDEKIRQGRVNELPKLFTHFAGDEFNSVEGTLKNPEKIKTEFVAVRFGNVLGSNGSVIPIFKKQIAKGGPVTVTHPDIIRYFMTIPEAVSLVLQAGTYAKGGEIFVLDMGMPVKIADLARNLIKLSGLRPDVDIKIDYTGLRPGEKLFEEKLMAEEGLKKTKNKLIHIGCPIPFEVNTFLDKLSNLMEIAYANDDMNIRSYVMDIVSTYHPADNSFDKKSDIRNIDSKNAAKIGPYAV